MPGIVPGDAERSEMIQKLDATRTGIPNREKCERTRRAPAGEGRNESGDPDDMLFRTIARRGKVGSATNFGIYAFPLPPIRS